MLDIDKQYRMTIKFEGTDPEETVCETEANARLIAAAPDLLAACKALSEFLAYGLGKPEGETPTKEDLERVAKLSRQASDAIGKAEGTKP